MARIAPSEALLAGRTPRWGEAAQALRRIALWSMTSPEDLCVVGRGRIVRESAPATSRIRDVPVVGLRRGWHKPEMPSLSRFLSRTSMRAPPARAQLQRHEMGDAARQESTFPPGQPNGSFPRRRIGFSLDFCGRRHKVVQVTKSPSAPEALVVYQEWPPCKKNSMERFHDVD